VRTVDARVMPNKITITPDPDPMKNMWNLGRARIRCRRA
jgi:hypothetical protein